MSKKILGACAVIATTLLSAPSAFAQKTDDLTRVEVSGQPITRVTRLDVSKACPDVAKTLQDSLGNIAERERSTGTVRVTFDLNGSQLGTVRASEGPFEYRSATRRAMYGVSCADGSGQPQRYSFVVSFNNPNARDATGQRMALVVVDESLAQR